MAVLDWLVLGAVLVSVAVGAWRGLVYEVLSLAAWVGAFFCARLFAEPVSRLGPWSAWEPSLAYATAFLTVFVVAVFACSLVAWLGQRLARAVGLQPADRSLGAAFGALRAGLILVVLAYMVLLTPLRGEPWWRGARSSVWLEEAVYWTASWVPESFSQRLPER